MKANLTLIGLIAFILFAFSPPAEEVMNSTSVMTYNIHLEGCGHSHPSWIERRSMVAQVIRLKSPEILGLQRATFGQLSWLNENLKRYDNYYPEDRTELGKDLCPILYDKNIYQAVESGTFFFGPEKGAASNFESPYANWVKLKHRAGDKIVYVINTVLSDNGDAHKGPETMLSLKDQIQNLTGKETFLLLGDMASEPESPTIKSFSEWTQDSHFSSLVSISEVEETFFGWEKDSNGERRDYVFLSPNIPANSHEVVDIAFQNRFPSDHLPVFCKVRLN